MSQFKLLEGQVVDGKYRLTKLLGAGGFGAVFQADWVVGDRVLRQVAVKLILPVDTSEAQAKQLNELQASVNLDHPHIIRCFAAGEFSLNYKKTLWDKIRELFSSESGSNQVSNGSFLYLVMELADYSLYSHLQDELLSGQPLYQMLAQVADALNHLHTNGRVHRDLKPGNVLWVKKVWKVSDFGRVRDLDAGNYVQTQDIAGTPWYMPPEALYGTVAPAWDIWALGVMSVVVATGYVPGVFLDGSLPSELELQVEKLSGLIPLEIAGLLDSLPSELKPLVQGCLQMDWRRRWTAQQALDAMLIIVQSLPPATPAQPQPQAPAQRIQPLTSPTSTSSTSANRDLYRDPLLGIDPALGTNPIRVIKPAPGRDPKLISDRPIDSITTDEEIRKRYHRDPMLGVDPLLGVDPILGTNPTPVIKPAPGRDPKLISDRPIDSITTDEETRKRYQS